MVDGCLTLACHIVENEMLNGEVIRLDSAHDAAQSGIYVGVLWSDSGVGPDTVAPLAATDDRRRRRLLQPVSVSTPCSTGGVAGAARSRVHSNNA